MDGFNAYLLETENVNTIAIDSANRKWFGTNNGIFRAVARRPHTNRALHDEQQPLFDNSITDIAIDPEAGEAWIGTQKGVLFACAANH
ncbi:MAG: hypothetical protein IPK76_19290 [Lewinellaceae bacterium]|nr:hypothetical protein [Lewinellaceae bacterium]